MLLVNIQESLATCECNSAGNYIAKHHLTSHGKGECTSAGIWNRSMTPCRVPETYTTQQYGSLNRT